MAAQKPIRLGMVGGGEGSFIGYVHRIASRLDGEYDLVAGALSSRPEVARRSAEALGIAPDRAYEHFDAMAKAEAARHDGIEAVAIVTPNHMHSAPVKAFLEAGIHVICDKPLTATLAEANSLAEVKPKNGARFLLSHNYTGYPMIRVARALVAEGRLGTLRVAHVEYAQDWLTEPLSNKQADWRADPAKAGPGGCIGDIGTHAYNLLRFASGLELEAVSADLNIFVAGRKVDDNVHMMLRFQGGARGMLWASQVAPGNENGIAIRIYGDRGGLEWRHSDANTLWVSEFGQPTQRLTRGSAGADIPIAGHRIPPGHPEGYFEAFATLYREFAGVIRGTSQGNQLPGLADGLEGMRFVAVAVASSAAGAKWVAFG
ncbi:Predicted dehydrogenase [Cribrihabitans marinus]|uniref:Predicted dehydrogenase n=1 Tax=Cribrihabitans marinus TaxID=1227549 RepID=A0A1H7EC81_9RHOB|nr:Gfo/Idh/MocA family oxidoreductase [Cribrihabitans marinus]GGH42085.1 oxidoreductase [Cribrihabitans marinus]SEK08235.1 Predicted dehydrogenase [Cribrihabitans marinus]